MYDVLTWVIAFGIAFFAVWVTRRLGSRLWRWLSAPQYGKAVHHALEGAKLGSTQCMISLGVANLKGQGVEEDHVEAFKWFTLAEKKEDAQASDYLKVLNSTLSSEQKEEGKRRADAWAAENAGR